MVLNGAAASASTDSLRAWLIVAAAFLAGFVVFGIVYSFGVFVETMASEFQASRAAMSAFFSVAGLAFYGFGPVTGHLGDRFGPRLVVAAGAVLLGGGLILTAFTRQMWVGYLAYGIGVGVGAACAYVPTLAVVGGWFAGGRNVALGIAAAGTGCGMLMMPPLAASLIEYYGWRVADLVLGAGCGLLLLISAALTGRSPLAAAPADRSLGDVVRSRAFVMLYLSWVLATVALFVPLVFLPAFALDQGASQVAAAALISLLGGMSVAGRLGLGVLAARVGTLRLFKAATFLMAMSYVLWLATDSYWWLVAFVAVLGLGYGVRISVIPAVLIDFFGLEGLGAILGIFFTATGIAALVGPLLAGFVVDLTGSYRWCVAFALAVGLSGFAAIVSLSPSPAPARD
jgi:MFS family permease